MNAPRPGPSSRPPLPSLPTGQPVPPPFRLPAEHFVAAHVWLMLGAVGLVVVAPRLARGGLLTPGVLAVTHLFTLGWITTTISGVLYQLFPVLLGVSARSIRLGHLTFATLTTGIAVLIAGFAFWLPPLLGVGWVFLFLAVGGLASNLLPQRRKAPNGGIIGLYISAGHIALGFVVLLGGARIGDFMGWWVTPRLPVLATHFHLGLLGFATLTAVGVGSRLLPMFLGSIGHPDWPLRWIAPLSWVGLILFSLGAIWSILPLTVAGGLFMASGVVLYLRLALSYFVRRGRPRLDPGLAHLDVAFGFLGLATALGIGLLLERGAALGRVAAYGILALLGWQTLFIVGVYYRILPALTWNTRFGPGAGRPGTPTVAQLSWTTMGWASLTLLSSGVAILAGGVWFASGAIAEAGALLFAGGTAAVLAHQVRLARYRRKT
jgi:hypothetical protein